jgi:hypothetical protein
MFASFQNFIAAEIRRARTEKRGGRVEVVRLDWEDEEGRTFVGTQSSRNAL